MPPPRADPSPGPSPTLSEVVPEAARSRIPSSLVHAPPTEDDNLISRIRVPNGAVAAQLRIRRLAGDQSAIGGSDDRVRRLGPARQRHASRERARDQAYGPRVPSIRPDQWQSLYDWAPERLPLPSVLVPPLVPRTELNEGTHRDLPFSLRSYSPSPPISGPSSQNRLSEESATARYADILGAPADDSLRTAFMQSIRQNPRRPQRSRPQWHGWSWEREQERDERDDFLRPRLDWGDPEITQRSRPARARQEHLRSQPASHEVEEAIRYLARLCSCHSHEEGLRLAVKSGFNRGEDWLELLEEESRCEDLLLDTRFLHVAETSWLKVGGEFCGSQTTPAAYLAPFRSASSSASSISSLPSNTTAAIASYQDDTHANLETSSSNARFNPSRWTVKVSISSIDYSQMRLTGTMEAYTDFQNSSTYLEGEIIDFKTHSLETFNFPSNTKDDANNWRKLEPFAQLSNEQLVKGLISKKFMGELTNKFILMRWKEKCFITPQSSSSENGVLTIGGFYFLSLRRSNGHIQGFYYDPKSQPYQELNLKPQKRHFPTYEFR